MQFIENSFAYKVRKNKIKSPLREDFSLQKWNDAPKQTEFDKTLHQAGLYFYEQFKKIRAELNNIASQPTPLSKEDYLKTFVGIANRSSKNILGQLENFMKNEKKHKSILELHAFKISSTPLKNEYSTSEAIIGIIDGIYYNILSHLKDEENAKIKNQENNEILKEILLENFLSQIYHAYEYYWNAVLYEQIEFELKDNALLLKENPKIMIPYLIHDIRKSEIPPYTTKENNKKIINSKYLTFNNNMISYEKFNNLHKDHQLSIILNFESFNNEASEFILKNLSQGEFNINEVICVFLNLSSLAHNIILNLDTEKSYKKTDYRKYKDFNKTLNLNELINNLNLATSLDVSKIEYVIDFLTIKNIKESGPRSDLWRYPIVKINQNECILVLEPLLHPIGLRCLEGWLAKANVDISQKGLFYENHIKNSLKNLLSSNKFVNNFNFLELDTISINGNKEEVDLLFKIDNLIVIGEAKCIVTTDSPISIWNSIEILKHASDQIKRKVEFISINFEEICQRFKWNFDKNTKYKFSPIILVSNGFGGGESFFDIPIIDHHILLSYFQRNFFPMNMDNNKNLTYLKIYSNPTELINNFYKFVSKPPLIEYRKLCLQPVQPIKLISCKDDFKEVIYHHRFGAIDTATKTLIEHNYGFEIIQSKIIN